MLFRPRSTLPQRAGFDGVTVGKRFRRLKDLTAGRLTDLENAEVMAAMMDMVREGLVRTRERTGERARGQGRGEGEGRCDAFCSGSCLACRGMRVESPVVV